MTSNPFLVFQDRAEHILADLPPRQAEEVRDLFLDLTKFYNHMLQGARQAAEAERRVRVKLEHIRDICNTQIRLFQVQNSALKDAALSLENRVRILEAAEVDWAQHLVQRERAFREDQLEMRQPELGEEMMEKLEESRR